MIYDLGMQTLRAADHLCSDPILSKLSIWYLHLCVGAYQHAQLGGLIDFSMQKALNKCKELKINTLDNHNLSLATSLLVYQKG